MEKFILCIETSNKICSVALCSETGKVILKENIEPNSHSKYLAVYIEELLKKLKNKKQQILAIAVSEGPGSYTGLRIGVSTAKGLAYGLDKPLIAIPTLDIMVQAVLNTEKLVSKVSFLVPMIDARRMEVYTGVFDLTGKQIKPTTNLILTEDSFSEFLKEKVAFFGDGAKKFIDLTANNNAIYIADIYPRAQFMSTLAFEKYDKQDFVDVAYFEPFYLKPFIPTTKPKPLVK